MPSLSEAADAKAQLAATLAAGVESISNDQTITFTKYCRVVLPLDGFVFWVRSDLLSADALRNVTQVGPNAVSSLPSFSAQGSLHFSVERQQLEDETLGVNRVVFTATSEVQPFNEISPAVMFVGAFNGVRFAFGQRRSYYRQADLHHYMGNAIYPAFASQIIDSIAELDISNRVVSNSLPVWLSLGRRFPIYPSYLVPDNLQPPYAAAHVIPESQRALQPFAAFDDKTSSMQLISERVKITTYGLRNDAIMDFVRDVNEFFVDTDTIGVMNMPVVRDEKRSQVELSTIAIKKSVEYEVSYYQTRVNDVARQLIAAAMPAFAILPIMETSYAPDAA